MYNSVCSEPICKALTEAYFIVGRYAYAILHTVHKARILQIILQIYTESVTMQIMSPTIENITYYMCFGV